MHYYSELAVVRVAPALVLEQARPGSESKESTR
jgi:hypothetical protein